MSSKEFILKGVEASTISVELRDEVDFAALQKAVADAFSVVQPEGIFVTRRDNTSYLSFKVLTPFL